MARIVAGTAKGRQLKVPGKGTRPTSERVREALFSRLEHWGYIDGCEILDVYAGSGAFALEALSRGASYAECVEASSEAARTIADNGRRCGLAPAVRCEKAQNWIAHAPNRRFDLVLLDPPYAVDEDEIEQVLAGLEPHLAADAMILVERSKRSPEPRWPSGTELVDERTWGDTRVWFARRDHNGA